MKPTPANIFVYIFLGIIFHISTLNLSECRLCTKKPNCDYSAAEKKARDVGQIVLRRRKERCCACGIANYKVTFIGMWSRHSHPRDFPGFMALWGPLIGCSHSNEYVVWRKGSKASSGVKRASEFCSAVDLLEDEMNSERPKILDIVKGKQIWGGVGTRSTMFRADKDRPYLSLMSKICPSPDWFVGVDSLSLCENRNCSWKNSLTVDLRPWDAGTDEGITFTSLNTASQPQQPIHRITSLYPKNPRASFYDPGGREMPPTAKLRVQLLGVSGSCHDSVEPKTPTTTPPRIHCQVSKWASWSRCSRGCGEGYQTRGRIVTQHPANGGIRCPTMKQRRICIGTRCKGKRCKVSQWSQWSECSKQCGRGIRTRRRTVVRKAKPGGGKCPDLIDTKKCRIRRCKAPPTDCVMSPWAPWEPCSKCGEKQKRTRTIISKKKEKTKCPRRKEKRQCQVGCTASTSTTRESLRRERGHR